MRNYGSSCMYAVRNSDIFGHWLSDKNTLEVKNFDTQSSYAILSITNQKFQRNPKMLNFDFSGLQIYLRPGKVPFAAVPNISLAR